MTKTMMTTVAIAAMLAVATSAARATDQNINITATTNAFCRINNSLTPADDALDWSTIISSDGFISATPTTKTYAVVCNKASNVSLTAVNGGLNTATPVAIGFDNIINYTTSTNGFALVPLSSTATNPAALTSESMGSFARPTPGAGNINVQITPVVNSNPLVPGNYADTLKLTILPQ